MSAVRIEWDARKARLNLRKHGVSFEEAETVFREEFAIQFYDDEHADWEDRFLLLGMRTRLNMLLVCRCYREQDDVIRIISARKATKAESEHYRRL